VIGEGHNPSSGAQSGGRGENGVDQGKKRSRFLNVGKQEGNGRAQKKN